MDLKSVFSNENQKKIVLVDKSSNIYHARRHLVEKYGVLLNTHVLTLDQYAMELTGELRYANNLEIIGREESLYLIEAILNSNVEPFEYYREDIISLNTYTEVLSTIIELKKTGITWDDQGLKGKLKTEELSKIYLEYEDALKNGCYIDEADVLKLPAEASEDSLHFVYENVSWLPLEKKFFEQCCSGEFRILPLQKPMILPRPNNYTYQSKEEAEDTGKILKAYSGEAEAKGIKIVKAYGLTNEIQGVFRDILVRGLPLDNCIILYTGGEYVDYIRNSADYFGIPTTIQEGYKLDNTSPYFLLSQLIWYVTKGFLTENLRPIFDSNVLDLKITDEAGALVSNSRIMEYIKGLRVGTGAKRLLRRLETYLYDCRENLVNTIERESHTYKSLERAVAIGSGLIPFISDLAELENLDWPTDRWLLVLREMTIEYTAITAEDTKNGGENARALDAIDLVMKNYIEGPCCYSSISVKWLYELEQRVKGARKDMHTPSPGRLHAARYANVMLVSRPYVYVVGLDAGHFPDTKGEASLLNDSDRRRMSPLLGLEPRKSDAVFKLLETVGDAQGEINLIYSYYDTVKVNEINPSSFIQTMLTKPGIVNSIFSFVPTCSEQALAPMEELMQQPSEFLGQGETTSPDLVEPVLGFLEGNVFSASQIEMMASCRRKYYYRYILGLPEGIEELLGHVGWLDAADRGTLLHSILEGVINEINKQDNLILENLVKDVCEREFESMEKEIPCTIKQHYSSLFSKFTEAVSRYARVYLQMKTSGEIKESITEKRFTECIEIQADFDSEEGSDVEKRINIVLRGLIDRLDVLSDDTISIIDYKSGRPFDESTANIEKLQDYLYSLAAEQIFKDRKFFAGVKEARYDFPLESAEGATWRVDPAKREVLMNGKARTVYQALTDIANGQYLRSPDAKPCTYCDYILHCRPHINGGEE